MTLKGLFAGNKVVEVGLTLQDCFTLASAHRPLSGRSSDRELCKEPSGFLGICTGDSVYPWEASLDLPLF